MAAGSVIKLPEGMLAGDTVKVTADNTVNTFVDDASLTMLNCTYIQKRSESC